MCINSPLSEQGSQNQALLFGALQQDKRQWAQLETQEILSVRKHFSDTDEHQNRMPRDAEPPSLLIVKT